jgi:o-succinylbenzoate synthase
MTGSVRIEQVDLHLVGLRLKEPFHTAGGPLEAREVLLVSVSAEGLTGWGECGAWPFPAYSSETTKTAWHVLEEFLIPAVLGQELDDVATLAARFAWVRGHRMARAALEMALWDLLGQAQGRPLGAMLGGVRDRVSVGVAVGLQPSPEVLVSRIALYLEEGYRRVKAKIAPGRDEAFLRAVRGAFPALRLQADGNGAYTLDDTAMLKRLDDLELLLIEQPLAGQDLIEQGILQAQLVTPLALDEGATSSARVKAALQLGACRAVCVKSGNVGGLTEAVAIHDLCVHRGVVAFCGGLLETTIGRAAGLALASLPGFTLPADLAASARYYVEDVAEPALLLNSDSTITVPTAPGIGAQVDPWRLERHTVAHQAFGSGSVA